MRRRDIGVALLERAGLHGLAEKLRQHRPAELGAVLVKGAPEVRAIPFADCQAPDRERRGPQDGVQVVLAEDDKRVGHGPGRFQLRECLAYLVRGGAAHDLREHLLFRAEVVVQRGFGGAGARGDVRHRGLIETHFPEHVESGIDDGLPLFFRLFPHA